MKKVSIWLIILIVLLLCGCEYIPNNCQEERTIIEEQEAIITAQEYQIKELEAQLPCEICSECPECPECEDIICPECEVCPDFLELKEFYSIGELKEWLKQDKTDESFAGDRNKIAMDLMLSALEDGYIMSVYPYKQTCPSKHYLLNLVLITRESRAWSINAETDEVAFHNLPYP